MRAAPLFLLGNTSTPATSLNEFLTYAKARSGKLTFGAASGSGIHLAGEQFRLATGLDITHVPYKGGGPILIDLSGGQITMAFFTAGVARLFIVSGRLRALATTSPKRSPVFPDVVTFTEAGYPSVNSERARGQVLTSWFSGLSIGAWRGR